ncbi:WD40 repeat domain-containing protein [Hymenobacter lapidiphilus]|nr:WD40 repeat domain-containing protein [Hymenobacter sp. CCM 8763]
MSGRLLRLSAATGFQDWTRTDGALSLALCPTAPIVATGSPDGQLTLRNAYTGKVAGRQLLGQGWIEQLSWSPNGRILAAACNSTLHLLDALGLPLGYYQHSTTITSLHWQADSRQLTTTSANAIRQFHGLEAAGVLEPHHVIPGEFPLGDAAWNAPASRLATSTPDGRLVCWRLPADRPSNRQPPRRLSGPARHLSWCSGGRLLASAHGSQVLVWPATPTGLGAQPLRLAGHEAAVRALAGQHQGPLLASADVAGRLALWHPGQHPHPVAICNFGSAISAIQWMPNDCCLAISTVGGRVAVLSVSMSE